MGESWSELKENLFVRNSRGKYQPVADLQGLNRGSLTEMQRRSGSWEAVSGLEVHAQVISESKLFSGSIAAFGAAPNS